LISIYFKTSIYDSRILKPQHVGAGLIDLFRHYRDLVPEFKEDLLFRAFLIAFQSHVKTTLELDWTDYPKAHWWKGSGYDQSTFFVDSGRGNAFAAFDEDGRQRLADNLADSTLKVIKMYQVCGFRQDYLRSSALAAGSDFLKQYIRAIPEEIAEEQLPEQSRHVPQFIPVGSPEAHWRAAVSKGMIAKRPPDLTEKEQQYRDRKKANQKAYDARKKAEKALPPAGSSLL